MKKKTIKYILFGIGWVLVGVVVFVLFSYLFRPVSSSRKNIIGLYAEEAKSLDVVYVGGSACYRFWEPLEAYHDFGFTSYNFATDAMPPQIIKYCMKEVLKTQDPQLFVVDIRPFQYGDAYDEETGTLRYLREAPLRNVIDNMKYSLNRYEAIENCVMDEEERVYYHFDIAKYHSVLVSLFNGENWRYIFNEYPLNTKGFEYSTEITPMEVGDFSAITEELALEERMDSMFIDLLEYCRDEKLQVLFVVNPYALNEYDQMKYNYMCRVIQEYGFDFLNTNNYVEEMQIDYSTDFYDMGHTNLLGAEKYTGFLGNYIKQNYELPDKRNDKKYQSWQDDYKEWEEMIAPIRAFMKEE